LAPEVVMIKHRRPNRRVCQTAAEI